MWETHPYNAGRGGPCRRQLDLLTDPEGMAAVKRRFAFVVERWGGSGAIFAWDLWNELGHDHGVASEAIDAGPGRPARRDRLRALAPRPGHRAPALRQDPPPDGQPLRGRARGAAGRPDLPPSRPRFRDHPRLRAGRHRCADEHGRRRRRHGAMGAPRPARDPRRPAVHRQRDRADPHLQGPGDHAARSCSTSTTSATCRGPTWPAEGPAGACAGRTASALADARHAPRAGRDGRIRPADRLAELRLAQRLGLLVVGPEELLAYACSDGRQAVIWVLRGQGNLGPDGDLAFRPLLREPGSKLPSMEPGTYAVDFVETWNGHTLMDDPTSRAGREGST